LCFILFYFIWIYFDLCLFWITCTPKLTSQACLDLFYVQLGTVATATGFGNTVTSTSARDLEIALKECASANAKARAKYTPLEQQFVEIKRTHRDLLLVVEGVVILATSLGTIF
jgi:hypothetical protein